MGVRRLSRAHETTSNTGVNSLVSRCWCWLLLLLLVCTRLVTAEISVSIDEVETLVGEPITISWTGGKDPISLVLSKDGEDVIIKGKYFSDFIVFFLASRQFWWWRN